MPESRTHIRAAIATINGHHTLSFRSRRLCCVRRNGAAHGSLACGLLQMGALVKGGIICAAATSQVGPRPRTLAGQDTRHCMCAFRHYSSCAVGIHPLLPMTFGKAPRLAGAIQNSMSVMAMLRQSWEGEYHVKRQTCDWPKRVRCSDA